MDLTGVWIGETIGYQMKRHHWLIIQKDNVLEFYTRWDDESSFAHFLGVFNDEKDSFIMATLYRQASEIVNENYFEIIGWLPAKKGEEIVPYYDVAFQRRETGFMGFVVAWLVRLFAGNQSLMRWI